MKKHALIVANLFGFGGFLLHDMELLIQLGYDVTFAARMNVPGRAFGNWLFRTTEETVEKIDTAYYQKINRLFKL